MTDDRLIPGDKVVYTMQCTDNYYPRLFSATVVTISPKFVTISIVTDKGVIKKRVKPSNLRHVDSLETSVRQ